MLLGPENPLRLLSATLLAVAIAAPPSIAGEHDDHRKVFNRIATFQVFLNLPRARIWAPRRSPRSSPPRKTATR
jgi:hypothetical protein